MILSDIDVHREQTDGASRYFGVDDPETLANHLLDACQAEPVVPRDLLPNLDERVRAFAAEFANAAKSAI